MPGNWHVRFGERRAETSRREAVWRCAPTLPFVGRVHRSLDGDPWPGERSARSPWARSVSGGRREPAFLTSREECRVFRGRGKKQAEPLREGDRGLWPALGLDQPFEVALDASHERTD